MHDDANKASLYTIRKAIPIRLVTDSYGQQNAVRNGPRDDASTFYDDDKTETGVEYEGMHSLDYQKS